MAHAQKLDFVFPRNGRVHSNRWGRQFSRLLAAEVCASALVMLDAPCSEAVWRVLATHSIRQFPLHFPSRASPCATRFRTSSTNLTTTCVEVCWMIKVTLVVVLLLGYLNQGSCLKGCNRIDGNWETKLFITRAIQMRSFGGWSTLTWLLWLWLILC